MSAASDKIAGAAPEVQEDLQALRDDVAKLTHTYAVGRVKGIEWPIIEVFSRAKIDKHLKRYKIGRAHV